MAINAKSFLNQLGFGQGDDAPVAAAQQPRSAAVTRLPITRSARRGNDVQQLRTFLPRSFNDAGEIATEYREGIPVIVNMENLDLPTRRRMVDFITGLKEALFGQVTRITESVYLVAPNHLIVDDGQDDAAFYDQDGRPIDDMIIPIN